MTFSIIHVITTIDLGGAEKQLLILAKCQKQSGAKVEIVYLKNQPYLLSKFRQADIEVSVKFAELNFLQQLLKLKNIAKTKGAVFHAHLPRSELLCALALPRGSFVVTRHNAETFFPKAPRIISSLLSRFVLNRASACVAISQAVAVFLQDSKELPRGTDPFVIYYGLEDTTVNTKQISEFGIKEKQITIGTIARLVPQKNLPLLLKAFQILNVKNPGIFSLTIAGVGPLGKNLRLMSADLNIESNITWADKLFSVEEFYKSIDLFVLTSNYEGFGLVLLEAMSHAVPIIARRISAIPEVLGEFHPGLIESDLPQEFAAKVEILTTNPEAKSRCLEYQTRQLSNFAIINTKDAYDQIYKDIRGRTLEFPS